MTKMHYFSNKFSKIAKRCRGSPPPASLNLQYWWPVVTWFDQIVFFQVDCDEIELQNISYNVIFVASSLFRQPSDVTKITSHNFLFWTPLSKFLALPVLAMIVFFR